MQKRLPLGLAQIVTRTLSSKAVFAFNMSLIKDLSIFVGGFAVPVVWICATELKVAYFFGIAVPCGDFGARALSGQPSASLPA